jgi:phosphoglycolate phosphatase
MALDGERDCVLFDLDGVLVDSRAAIAASMNHALLTHDLPRRDPPDLHDLIGPPLAECFADLAGERTDSALVGRCVKAYRDHYAQASLRETTVVPGIAVVLGQLSHTHNLAVATSKSRPFAEPLLAHLDLSDFFVVISAPSATALTESKADTIDAALDALEGPERALMVGDRFHDILGAKAHGLPSIGVKWGIGRSDELALAGADRIVETPDQLPAIIGELLTH